MSHEIKTRIRPRSSLSPAREPALICATLGAAAQLVVSLTFHLTVDQQGLVNALVVAATGLVTAAAVRSDQLVPAILGVAQAGIALALALGLHLTATEQAAVMSLVTAAAGMFVRTQVTAPISSGTTLSRLL